MIESKVAYLEAPKKLVFRTEPLSTADISPTSVLCETLSSTVSPGTEVAAYVGAPALRPGNIYPRLVGYCNVARVLRTGKNVANICEGDRVLTFSAHRSHFIVDQGAILATLPSDLASTPASCTYLYHLGYDAVTKAQVNYGSRVVVIGLGVLGLGAIDMAVKSGATVYAISDHEVPISIASRLGAEECFNRNEQDKLKSALGSRLADVVITTSNHWEDWNTALKTAGQNSFIAVIGFPGRTSQTISFNPLDSQYFYQKQLRIQAVGMAPEKIDARQFLRFNEKDNVQFLLSQIHQGQLDPSLLITAELDWSELAYAYESLLSHTDSPITYSLLWKR